jgi:hypothetical protein
MLALFRCRGLFTPVAILLVLTSSPARAAGPKPSETALGKVPADVEYFGSMLRLGETIEIIGKSQAWKQIWNDPMVQEFWKKGLEQLRQDEQWARVRDFFANPANAELPALAADALSNEIFVYAGAGSSDLVKLLQEVGGTARFGPALQQLLKQQPGEDSTRAVARAAMLALQEKPERLRVPALVIGFKVSDPEKVAAQLQRIDPVLAEALKGTPLAGRSKRVKVADDEFLILDLDGSLIPWEQVPLADYENDMGEFEPLLKRLKAMKLAVAIGVRQGYLLIAVGESTAHIEKFGGPGAKLAGIAEMKPVEKFADKPITAVSYTSAKLLEVTATSAEDVTGYADAAKQLLRQTNLPEETLKPIDKDIDALAKSIIKGLTKPGAQVSLSHRTPRGWETFAYDYTKRESGEPRPRTLLDHLGGEPLLAVVWRSGTTVEDYRAFVQWVAKFAGHAETIVAGLSPDSAEMIKKVRAELGPIVKELSDITERLWIPALADGQEAFVLDAKWASKQWHAALEADRQLPMIELGVVLGVSDAAKLRQALEGYRATINKLIAKVAEFDPNGNIPPVEIPKPNVERKGDRTFAFYPIPEEWGLDPQFQPTGGLSAKVAVLALSRKHAERLLTPSPLTPGLAPFRDTRRPLESALYWNWEGMMDAAGPWAGFLLAKIEDADQRKQAEDIGARVLKYLKIFRSYGSVTYREGDVTVTHSEAVFRDILPVAGK